MIKCFCFLKAFLVKVKVASLVLKIMKEKQQQQSQKVENVRL